MAVTQSNSAVGDQCYNLDVPTVECMQNYVHNEKKKENCDVGMCPRFCLSKIKVQVRQKEKGGLCACKEERTDKYNGRIRSFVQLSTAHWKKLNGLTRNTLKVRPDRVGIEWRWYLLVLPDATKQAS